jgi:hypothetical protein
MTDPLMAGADPLAVASEGRACDAAARIVEGRLADRRIAASGGAGRLAAAAGLAERRGAIPLLMTAPPMPARRAGWPADGPALTGWPPTAERCSPAPERAC